MKIYIAYKLSGRNLDELRPKLEYISDILEKLNHETFIYLRDVQNWRPYIRDTKKIMSQAQTEMRNSDCILSFIDTSEKGEGLLLESGFMKGLEKKVYVLIGKRSRFPLLKAIADKVMEYGDDESLKTKLREIF